MIKEIEIKIERDKNPNLEDLMIVNKKTILELFRANPNIVAVYLYLLNIQQHNDYYIGTQDDLAKEMNISLSALNKYLKILKKLGYLKMIRNGQHKGTKYIALMEKSE